jgi:hypothetical protein
MKLIFILSVSVCSSCIAFAADAASSMSGGVIDDSGNAVSNVLVDVHRVRQFTRDETGRLVGEATNFSAAVITDVNGNFGSLVSLRANTWPAPIRVNWGTYRTASGTKRFQR